MKRITGTFLDEITHDIPSQNWGRQDWRREFELYRRIGIDTIILIRGGYRDRCVFPALSLPNLMPVQEDLARVFVDLAEEFSLQLYFGTYDSGVHWHRGAYWKEIDLNRAFVDEVAERYGGSPAFAGWYLCHETSRHDSHIVELFREISSHCRQAKNVPVLISPFPEGSKQVGTANAFTLEESLDHWDRIFEETREFIDICAFQDGQIDYSEIDEFHRGMSALGRKHGILMWANVESFDRDMPIKFPPADWRRLRHKIELASREVEKLVTFEFAHFMSPHSCYLAARNLYARYAEEFGIKEP